MARKKNMAQRKYEWATSKALRDYNEAVESGVDSRAAATAYTKALKAAQVEYFGAYMKVASRDYGKANFYGGAGAAAVGGASTLAGTAASSTTGVGSPRTTVGGSVTTGVTPTTIRETMTTPKVVEQQQSTGKAVQAAGQQELKKVQEFTKSEIKAQETLAPIRERRRRRAEQEASLLRRQTGRRALLSSPAGGAGFFTGYFK